MVKRILSTFTLWAVVILCIRFLGSTGGVWMVTAIAVLTLREFFGLLRRMGMQPFERLGLTMGALLCLGPLYLEPHGVGSSAIVALTVIAFSVRILGERQAHSRVETLAWTLFGVLYVPFMLHYLVRIILIGQPAPATGLVFCIWLIAVTKFCDVGALLAGLAFGRHKMAPNISPKKTWEGAVGGGLLSMAIGAGLAWWLHDYLPGSFSPFAAAVLALPLAALAIVSDLIESIIKRRAEAKDAGRTIPGIGGFFDLSDSLILTAPLGYVVFTLL